MKDTYKWGAVAFGITLVSTFVYGQARTPYTRPAYITTPGSVSTSASGDQFVCTNSTAVCEVESSINATTMTSTVPAFDIGPTATPGTDDRLACFSYGPSGSKTRTMCVDVEGDVSSIGSFNSSIASGNQAFTCTNTGCRLSLGNTGRYLVDDGTNLEFVAPVQATTFEATTASGSALTGGGASGPLLLTSNTPDAVTSSTVPAIKLQASVDITNSDLLMSVEDNANNRRMTLTEAGAANFSGAVVAGGQFTTSSQYETTFGFFTATGSTASLVSNVGSTTTSVNLRSTVTKTGDTTKLVDITNNTANVAHFSKDGLLRVNSANAARPTCNADNRGRVFYLDGAAGVRDTYEICSKNEADAYAWVQQTFSSDNSGGTLLITSNTPDSVTGINGPAAITMQSSVALTSGDQVFRVLRNDGTQLFAVRNTGALVAGESTGQATINFGRWNSQQTAPTEWTNDAALTEKNPMRITHVKDVVADDASLLSIYDNIGTSATRQFYVSKDGLIRVNASNAAKPTCNADNRGRIFFLDGASLVADTFEVCGKDATNAYAWKAIVTF